MTERAKTRSPTVSRTKAPPGIFAARSGARPAHVDPDDLGAMLERGRQRVGRPCKLTRWLILEIVLLVKNGAHVEAAALAVGIRRATYYDWKKKGESEPPHSKLHREFSDAVAQAEAEAQAIAAVAARTGDKGAQWWLQRRNPGQWGRTLALTGPEGAPLAVGTGAVEMYRRPGVKLPESDED